LLYVLLDAVDGQRDIDDVAERVSVEYGRTLRPGDAQRLLDTKLRPMGLLVRPDGTQPAVKRVNPLLALRFRWVVSDPERTNRITRPFSVLFHPLILVPMVVAFATVCWWTLFHQGLATATHDAFARPELLLAVFALTLVSAGFHEFGHAAAARYGGATPGAMGAGIYLVWPAFYTDVTDAYRLGRGGRVRTDLGGVYFNAVFSVGAFGLWWLTGWQALLLIIPAQLLQMIHQMTPMLRFDGYHVLADLTGVPDLYHRIKPTLLGLLPHRWHHPETTALKPWARAVVSLWILLVIPVQLLSLSLMVLAFPRVVGTAGQGMRVQTHLLADAWAHADIAMIGVRVLSILALAVSVLGIVYIVVRVLRRISRRVWRATADHPRRRVCAEITALIAVASLLVAWWPREDNYRPVRAADRGAIPDVMSAAVAGPPQDLHAGSTESAHAVWPTAAPPASTSATTVAPVPTRERPVLAVVMVPRQAASGDEAPAWVFPFNRPKPPAEGDNQAFALNTTDGTVVYQVAFALVWVRDGDVLNKNEAYAYASCTNCAAVAVGFQVIMVVGDVNVVVPQNLSGSLNYACVQCLTYALASQLVVSLPDELSPEAMDQLTALWDEIGDFGEHIADVPLTELQADLDGFKDRIVDVIEGEVTVNAGTGTTTTSTDETTTTAAATSSTSAVSDPSTTAASTEPPTTTTEPASSTEAPSTTEAPTTSAEPASTEEPTTTVS
jgi:putative peptide zinc metalloprotease protein